MLLLIPHEIETLQQERPWANYLIVALCTLVSLVALLGGGLDSGQFDSLILDGFSLPGFFGHIFLHADFFHLVGNMIFLWVFGNAVCSNIGNPIYLAVFLLSTALAAATHNIVDGGPAIGASGAINGIVGMTLAMYPLNRIYLYWFFIITGGSTSCKAWLIIVTGFLFDLFGAFFGGGLIAYSAHLGGFFTGLSFGLAALHYNWFQLTEFDNRCLLEILKGEEWD